MKINLYNCMILESMDTSEHMPPVDPLTKSLPAYSKGTVVYIPSNEEKGKVSIRRLFVAAQIPNPMDKDNPLIGLSPKPNGLEPDVMVYKNYEASSLAGISFTVGQEIPVQRSPKTGETEGKIEISGWVITAIDDSSTPQDPLVTVKHPTDGKKHIPMSILHALREKLAAPSTDKSVSLVGSGDHKIPAEAMVPAAKPEGSSLDLVRAKIAAEEKPTSSEESRETKAHQYAETIRRKGTIIRYGQIIGHETSTLQAVASYEKGGALNPNGYKGPSRLHALLTNPKDELYPFISEIIDDIAPSADHLVLLPVIGDEPTINFVYINSSTSTEMAWKSPVIFGFELPRQEGNHLLEAIQTDPELMRSIISNYAGTNSVAIGQDRTLNITRFAPNEAGPSWNLFKKTKVNKWNQSTQKLPYITSALI